MPRKALVDKEDAIRTIEKFIEHFRTDDLPKFTSDVWVEMSKDLNGKWTPHCVYVAVRENRRNILTIARKNQGIVMPYDEEEEDLSHSSPTTTSVAKIKRKIDIETEVKAHLKSLKTWYYLTLDGDLWERVKPRITFKYGEKEDKYEISTPTEWTEAIFDAFHDEFHFPCAYILKRANVYTVRDCLHYIEIYAECRSQECSNRFLGFVEKEPWYGEPLDIKIKTWDTTSHEHEAVYRPARGIKRQTDEECSTGTSSNRKKRTAKKVNVKAENSQFNNGNIIKKENKEIEESDSLSGDLIDSFENINAMPEYHHSIQSIGILPFNVSYTASRQTHAFNEYCKREEWPLVKIDIRKGLIRKISRKFDSRPSEMFLLSLVYNFSGNPFLACQTISESLNFPVLGYWLASWIHMGAHKPKEAVSNYSPILLSAMCWAFNNFSLEQYVANQFTVLSSTELSEYKRRQNPPETYIRVDLTDLMSRVSQWKCFEKVNHPCIREFYIRCFDLMLHAQNFNEFSELLFLVVTVAFSARDDAVLESKNTTSRSVRKNLEAIIASNEKVIQVPDYAEENHFTDEELGLKSNFVNTYQLEPVTEWIEAVAQEAKSLVNPGSELNAYYLPEFANNLLSLAFYFPLWTNFTAPSEQISMKFVEDYHRDWEPRILERISSNSKFPVRADHFVTAHIKEIDNSLTFFESLVENSSVQRVSTHGDVSITYSGNSVHVTRLPNKEEVSFMEYLEEDKNNTSTSANDAIALVEQSNDSQIKPNSNLRNKAQVNDNVLSASLVETDELGVCRRRNISLDFSEL